MSHVIVINIIVVARRLFVQWRFLRGIEPQFLALQKGCNELIPQHLLKPFDERELEVSGKPYHQQKILSFFLLFRGLNFPSITFLKLSKTKLVICFYPYIDVCKHCVLDTFPSSVVKIQMQSIGWDSNPLPFPF